MEKECFKGLAALDKKKPEKSLEKRLAALDKKEPKNSFEEKLVILAKNGNTEAFDILIKRYRRMILSIAYAASKNEYDACDMAQEVFLKLYKNIGRFEGKSKFSTWAYRVAKNTCIDEIRRIKRINKRYFENENKLSRLEEKNPLKLPEEGLIKNELDACISLALKKLPRAYGEALRLRYINGLSYNQLADEMGCSVGTVKSRLYRAKLGMRKLLSEELKDI